MSQWLQGHDKDFLRECCRDEGALQRLIAWLDSDDVRARMVQTPPKNVSYAQLSAIIESSQEAIVSRDLNGIITTWNRGAELVYGYRADEAIGSHMFPIVVPKYIPQVRNNFMRMARGEFIERFVAEFFHRDGSIHVVSMSISPILDADGIVTGGVAIAQDITELKQVQDALIESEALHRAIVTTTTEGIVVQGLDGSIQMCNTSAEHILGLSQAQMMGRTSIDPRWRAIHEDLSAFPGETHPAMVALQSGQPVLNVVMGVHKPDNTLTWILINSQPLFHENDPQPRAVVTSFTDITQLKQMEQQARRLEMKRARIKLLSDFISNTSHELKTPLAVIGNSVYLYSKLQDEKRKDEKLKLISEQIRHLVGLIDEMQEMVKLEDVQFDLQPIAIQPLLHATINRYVSNSKNIRIDLQMPKIPTLILMDENYFQLAFKHLLENALRYTPENGQVWIEVVPLSADKIQLTVKDNGVGISDEQIAHIFERFYKGNEARTSDGSGMGLGLSMVKRIIKLHNGTIGVTSQEGVGTTFTMVLPIKRV
jgi:PAS domain S-box-containing protein